ncbi:glutamate--cysteine ligase [Salinisphaera sp. USBA-960]|uniref:glutamate--cysteine ligase n=1 Tax=Salinisphaera orenii TaxID=856731 RepID=UPI000DBE4676|nr:glutamate--cysteine ligase [Salifodinibacter halophilus]NNC25527.1 glutamate--cysteine ligase [Salifodinibacter halophilus]
MSAPSKSGGAPISDRRQLINYFEEGCKPPSRWRLGTEHEKFVFDRDSLQPLPFYGQRSISAFLQRLTEYGWTPMFEGDDVVALESGGCHITLEPGGQLELAGAPLESIHEACNEVNAHLDQAKAVGDELGAGLIGLGFQPKWARDECPWMPRERYKIMGDYMPKVGSLGLDMMLRTSTVQVNIDYGSEADMIKKFRVGLALQPIATALFANSPFTEGRPNGYKSYRSHIWTDTDPDRSGMLDWVFESNMGFESYVDYALDVPMYFVFRDGQYLDAAGQSFRDFLAGKLPALPGEYPTLSDWDDHLTTLFPEVRLKRFMEMRGADGGPWGRLCALPALWAGLCYDSQALDEAWQLCRDFTRDERHYLRERAAVDGLAASFRGRPLAATAREVLAIARRGLERRARLDSFERDETQFLKQLEAIADSETTAADDLLSLYHGRWRESVDPVFTEFAY